MEFYIGEIRIIRKMGDESGIIFNLIVVVRDNGELLLLVFVVIIIVVVDRVFKIFFDI